MSQCGTEFHRLAAYLFAVASTFATFYERCLILEPPYPEVRASRLVLTDLTGRTLSAGLGMLGIGAPDRM
ncbi:DALR anticodon-binding domain-containing protein [Nocardia yamanashiensis]|uniref:DALR anticodon-binding domain-containing protein n=1 Tax=Nocardia yamanashiensis TaxID=209247 RepID=UPI00082C703D|nr:DALR anticodon-binding domain-containing protein [Nocardia yamanashiensis]